MKLQIAVNDEQVIEMDVPPGLPRMQKVILRWDVTSVEGFAARVDELGGLEDFFLSEMEPPSAYRFTLPMRCAGENVGTATLQVTLTELPEPEPQPGPLAGLISQQEARRKQRAERESEAVA